jgi:hypothetical protein
MGSSPSIHDVNAERAERIAIVIQNRIFSKQSPFAEKMENVLWTHFARMEAQESIPSSKGAVLKEGHSVGAALRAARVSLFIVWHTAQFFSWCHTFSCVI